MAKPAKDNFTEAKRIAARMLATPPQPHADSKAGKGKAGAGKPPKRTSGKGRARVGKARS